MTSSAAGASGAAGLPDYAPGPRSALGPALNDQGYFAGRAERNLYWVTDGVYQSAFLTTPDGVVLFDAPPGIGYNLRRAVDEIAAADGVSNTVTHLVCSHHHADHAAASWLFDGDMARIGQREAAGLLIRQMGATGRAVQPAGHPPPPPGPGTVPPCAPTAPRPAGASAGRAAVGAGP